MTTPHRAALGGPRTGGVAARLALIHWGGRMFRREWRQQTLVVILLTVAVTAAIASITIVYNTALRTTPSTARPPTCSLRRQPFPSARGRACLRGRHFGTIEVIGHRSVAVPAASRLSTSARRTTRRLRQRAPRTPPRQLPDRTARGRRHRRGREAPPARARLDPGARRPAPNRGRDRREPAQAERRVRPRRSLIGPVAGPRDGSDPRERRVDRDPSHRQRQGARERNLRSGVQEP